MSITRIIGLVVASLFIGVSALNAQGSTATSQPESADTDSEETADVQDDRPREGTRPDGQGQTGNIAQVTTDSIVVQTLDLDDLTLDLNDLDEKKVLLAFPFEATNAFAIMVAGEHGVKIPMAIVAGYLELDLDVFRSLSELSVREARIWVGTAAQVFFIDVRIDANLVTFTMIGGDGGVVILPHP